MRGVVLPVVFVLFVAGCVAPAADLAAEEGAVPAVADCLGVVGGVDLQTATVLDLQQALEAGTLTSVQLVEAYIARIAAYDAIDGPGPKVNSVQVVNPNALAHAAALDAERAAGSVRGPLHGIPILLKDNVGTTEMATTAGSIALATNVPAANATLTDRLVDEGAIILGKAKLSEFANWVSLRMPSGYSSLGGQVVNAYTGGNPSGSSSGSGVAGSMALAAVTIGTETSGSILSPSIANSLVGLKPTTGLVSRAGVIPLAGSFDTPGPMGRTVTDAAVVLQAIAGEDPADARTRGAPDDDYLAALRPDALQGARLGHLPSEDPVFTQALADLEAQGATLVPVDPKETDSVSLLEIPLIFNEFKAGINAYLATTAGPEVTVRTLDDIILYNQQHPDKVKYGQDLLLTSDATPGLQALADVAAGPVIATNQRVALDLFAAHDVDAIVGRNAPLTGLGAAAGFPTIVVPAGYDGKDPIGLSFFGPAWSETRLLGFAFAYEQATQRRVPPTTLVPALLDGVCT